MSSFQKPPVKQKKMTTLEELFEEGRQAAFYTAAAPCLHSPESGSRNPAL